MGALSTPHVGDFDSGQVIMTPPLTLVASATLQGKYLSSPAALAVLSASTPHSAGRGFSGLYKLAEPCSKLTGGYLLAQKMTLQFRPWKPNRETTQQTYWETPLHPIMLFMIKVLEQSRRWRYGLVHAQVECDAFQPGQPHCVNGLLLVFLQNFKAGTCQP